MEHPDFILQDSVDCLSKARDFHLLQNWRSYMPNSIKKDDIKKPGSLLRWLFVQTNDEVEQKRLFDTFLLDGGSIRQRAVLLYNCGVKIFFNYKIKQVLTIKTFQANKK